MRTTTTTSIDGLAELERRLMGFGPEIATKLGQAATRRAMKSVAEPALRSATPIGPRADGTKVGRRIHTKIRTAIRVKKGRSKVANSVVTIITTGRAFHAIFIERGTVKMPAQPFAQQAIEGAAQRILDALGVELGKGIDRYVRRNP